ncbi:MAG: amidohydrolase family protein [Phycisphaerales bacterium JB065]
MPRAFLRMLTCVWAVLGALLVSTPAMAGGSMAITGARILPMSERGPAVIENGVVIVRDGVIVSVGDASTRIPSDLPVIDLNGATIMPGMVIADTGLAGRHAGDQSISGLYHAIDAFNRFGDYRPLLAQGITTVHMNPGDHRLVSGAGAVVRLSGAWKDRVLNAASDITVNLSNAARNPPKLLDPLKKPSADNMIVPAQPQAPSSRMEEWPTLHEAIENASEDSVSAHLMAFGRLWEAGLPLRFQAEDALDAANAVKILDRAERDGYVVGSFDLDTAASILDASGVSLVYGLAMPVRTSARDLGDRESLSDPDLSKLARFDRDRLALSVGQGVSLNDLRLAAAFAMRDGLDHDTVLRALTVNPARILGVSDRVGSIAPGRLADLVVYSDDPLNPTAAVQRVYMDGRLAYKAEHSGSVVVRAGTVWTGTGDYLSDAEVLVRDGKIVEVGHRVARPKGTVVLDAGPGSFVTPGFVDGRGHLGLDGDRAATGTNLDLSDLIGVPGASERRVANAGVTSVLLSPYSFGRSGSRISAIKSFGEGREDRVVRSSAAVAMDISGSDPITIERQIDQRLGQARQYDEKWKKYENDLAEWKKAAAEGKAKKPAEPKVVVDEAQDKPKTDPITGTWEMRAESDMLPEPIEGEIALKLSGSNFEGRATSPEAAEVEHKIVGTIDGNTISGTIEIDTGGFGTPTFTGTLGEGTMEGTISLGPISATFSGERTSTEEVQFRVTRRRATGDDGRPKPPPIDESLEPFRPIFAGDAPLIVGANTPLEIDAVVSAVVDKHKLRLVLLGAEYADVRTERLASAGVGVILSPSMTVRRGDDELHMPTVLSGAGIPVAFQSDAEDGARNLVRTAIFAVQQGMSPQAAMEALTINPATIFGLEGRIGSIAPGLDGDLVIYDGHPLDAATRVQRVLINGEEVQ